jgi:hypothetical protein
VNPRVLLALVLLALTIGCNGNEPSAFPDAPEGVVLFSIDPTYRSKELGNLSPDQEKAEKLHGYRLLGKTEITDGTVRRKVVTAVKEAIKNAPPNPAKCFDPRHVLRITKAGKTIDLVICFACKQYEIFQPDSEVHGQAKTIAADAQPALDQVLTDAGVPLAPSVLTRN